MPTIDSILANRSPLFGVLPVDRNGLALWRAPTKGPQMSRSAALRLSLTILIGTGTAQALATRAPRFVSWALAAAESALVGPVEVAVIGSPDDASTASLLRTALRDAPPGSAVCLGAPDPAGESDTPLLRHRDLVDGRPAAYVCRGFVCRVPVSSPDDLMGELAMVAGRT